MKLFTLFLFLFSFNIFGGVNIKNGNFYISYTDIVVPGPGPDLKITRTCNSKSIKVGWFGFCWGSSYEVYLTVSADGSVVIHENGAGALTRFTPKKAVNAKAAAKKIVAAMRKKTSLSDKVAKDLIRKLTKDASLRQEYARKHGVKASLAKGTVLYANTRGLQELHVTRKGFERRYNSGKIEYFDKNGRLVKITEKNGYWVDFNYKNNLLQSIKDSFAKQLFFSWFPSGRVKFIWSTGKEKARYWFSGDDLIKSRDVAGNTFKYGYDRNHNMTSVTYSDGTEMKMAYTDKTQFVKEVVNRNGSKTDYKYTSDPKRPKGHYSTKVTRWGVPDKKGKRRKISSNTYEYEIKKRPDGSSYTHKTVTVVNGLRTETIYSECCSLPLTIKRGKDVTTFEYNSDALLTRKTSKEGTINIEYHKKFKKISKLIKKDGWTKFWYNAKRLLSRAENDKGQRIFLSYDSKARINKMIEKYRKRQGKKYKEEKRVLKFSYNALDRPVEISMKNFGKINVDYDNYGEIKNVESKSGPEMALEVTRAFQSLLSIVRPAGVNLSAI